MVFEMQLSQSREREDAPYEEELMSTLKIEKEDAADLVSMYRTYCAQANVDPDNEALTMRTIRQFLSAKKPQIKEEFRDSLLGQSGCFPSSVKSCILAAANGIDTRLARSLKTTRALHILLVFPDGRTFDPTEAMKGEVVPMTMGEVRKYDRFVQPIVTSTGRWRHDLRKARAERKGKVLKPQERTG